TERFPVTFEDVTLASGVTPAALLTATDEKLNVLTGIVCAVVPSKLNVPVPPARVPVPLIVFARLTVPVVKVRVALRLPPPLVRVMFPPTVRVPALTVRFSSLLPVDGAVRATSLATVSDALLAANETVLALLFIVSEFAAAL